MLFNIVVNKKPESTKIGKIINRPPKIQIVSPSCSGTKNQGTVWILKVTKEEDNI